MQNVVTLVTDPKHTKLDEKIINKVFVKLEKCGSKIQNIVWLAENEALDILFTGVKTNKIHEKLSEALPDMKVDFILQPAENRKKKMLISDMDSTIIEQECIDEIAATVGLKEKVAAITERSMNGELDFKASLKERVALLAGIEADKMQGIYDEKISLMPGAKELIATMRKNNAYCLLVSGGFTFFTEQIKNKVGFNETHANILMIENGKLTGRVKEPILDKDSKLDSLKAKVKELGISVEDVIAVGDGANDLPMLKNAGLGIAYHAKPKVQEEVKARVNFTGLTTLLYAQGYRKEEIDNWNLDE